MDASLGARDRWMRRAGPFFPLLVAAIGQTRLPVVTDLTPTDEDRDAAHAWGPVVGALLGAALGFLAAIVAELGLVETAVAAIVASSWVLVGGAWAEAGTARRAERLLGDPDSSNSLGRTGTFIIVFVVSLLLRITLLTSIDLGAWTGALFASAVVARWAPLCAERGGAVIAWVVQALGRGNRDGEDAPAAVALDKTALIVTALVVLIVPLFTGGAGFVALILALAVGAGAAWMRAEGAAPWIIIAVELLALLCFAASGTFPLLGA